MIPFGGNYGDYYNYYNSFYNPYSGMLDVAYGILSLLLLSPPAQQPYLRIPTCMKTETKMNKINSIPGIPFGMLFF